MSIFQIKEWWSTSVGNNEEFDKQSICISNVDNSPTNENKIIIGMYTLITHYIFLGSF